MSQNAAETETRPKAAKIHPKCSPRAFRVGPCRKRLPTRRQKEPQGRPKMRQKSHPGGSLGGVAQKLPKAPQGCLQVPPEAQNDIKTVTRWDQKWRHNSGRETCSTTEQQRDQREAGIHPGQPRGERSWHTSRTAPRREKELAYNPRITGKRDAAATEAITCPCLPRRNGRSQPEFAAAAYRCQMTACQIQGAIFKQLNA